MFNNLFPLPQTAAIVGITDLLSMLSRLALVVCGLATAAGLPADRMNTLEPTSKHDGDAKVHKKHDDTHKHHPPKEDSPSVKPTNGTELIKTSDTCKPYCSKKVENGEKTWKQVCNWPGCVGCDECALLAEETCKPYCAKNVAQGTHT